MDSNVWFEVRTSNDEFIERFSDIKSAHECILEDARNGEDVSGLSICKVERIMIAKRSDVVFEMVEESYGK